VIADYPYESGELALAPGGWLCAVSDGVTEAMNPRGELYSAARLLAALAADGSREPQAVLASVREDVRRFAAGAEQSDDVTLVCARWNGSQFGDGARTMAAATGESSGSVPEFRPTGR
jgi:sigma-B regulation protein RsbU (phosphoserine phosphatase)